MVKNLKDIRMLVVGDIMIDRYVHGEMVGISSEAPVPVMNHYKTVDIPGGVGDIAINIVDVIGSQVPFICSVSGFGKDRCLLENMLIEKGLNVSGIVDDKSRLVTKKTRIFAGAQQVLRINDGTDTPIDSDTVDSLMKIVERVISDIDIVIISDYNKGVITKEFMERLIPTAKNNNKIVVVNSKVDHLEYYSGATCVVTSLKEIEQHLGCKLTSEIGKTTIKKTVDNLKFDLILVVTEDGGLIFVDKNEVVDIPLYVDRTYNINDVIDYYTLLRILG